MLKSANQHNKQINTAQSGSEEKVAFLGSGNAIDSGAPWLIKLRMADRETEFKIDTGADVTVIQASMYSTMHFGGLEKTVKVLLGPGHTQLPVEGKFSNTLSKGSTHTIQDVYVVTGLRLPLLGRPAIKALGLVARVDTLSLDSTETVKIQFPKPFQGLGKMEGEYEISLKADAEPFSLSTQRRISLPLLPKVKQVLSRMESLGVISRVEQPTDWLARWWLLREMRR